jgi:N-acyl homoserine lactone hydrolase
LFEVYSGPRIIGICGFALQTDAGEVVLIDTGFPEKYTRDADAATIEDGLGSFGRVLHFTPENTPLAQLAKLGLAKPDVTLMIQSHTHIDHIGHMDGFADVPILIAAAERALRQQLKTQRGQHGVQLGQFAGVVGGQDNFHEIGLQPLSHIGLLLFI